MAGLISTPAPSSNGAALATAPLGVAVPAGWNYADPLPSTLATGLNAYDINNIKNNVPGSFGSWTPGVNPYASGTSSATTWAADNPTASGSSGSQPAQWQTPNQLNSPFSPATAAQIDTSSPKMTVAGNIGNYLDPNSDVNQMIKTKALEAANQGGTLNSSMTDSAVSNGIIANAQQMAQNDQNTYANASGQNASLSTNAAINNMQGLNQLGIAQLGQQTQLQLQNLQNQNKTLLQSSSVAQQVYNTALQQIGTIQGNSAYDAATKNTLINQIMQATQAQLQDQSSITGLNVGQYFGNYSSTPTA